MIDRAIQPPIHSGFSFKLMQYNRHEFANGCILYNFPYNILPVARLEFIFTAGRKFQKRPLIAGFTGKMLFEGTSEMNQQQIADAFDITGATVNAAVNEDYAVLTVMCTTVNLSDVLKQLHHVLTDSVFPAEQLKTHTANDKQEYLINLQKVSFLARRKFIQSLFPENHPYARFADEEDFDHVTQKDVVNFFKQYYRINSCMVFWTGHISTEHFDLLERLFGNIFHQDLEPEAPDMSFIPVEGKKESIEVEGAKQSAICLGRIVPGIAHEDYYNLSIVNTILGGYFGSRLMRNIREEKGYTYGIGSHIVSHQDASYLIVSTQVKAEFTLETIREINKEFNRLQNESVPDEELELVRNYLMGSLLQNLDGPFAQAKFISTAIRFGLDAQDFAEKISSSIRQISPKIIKDIAYIYFKTEPLNYSVSGNTKEIFK